MALSAADQKVLDNIDEHGWSCMHVGEGRSGEPNFSYSIGWWAAAQAPECIVFGLPKNLQHSVLWEVYRQVSAGLKLADGLRVRDLIEGFDCVVRPVHETQMPEYLGFAGWYRHRQLGSAEGLKAFQIFWPGKQQRLFPWEQDCNEDVRRWQPLLYLPLGVAAA